MVYITQGVHSYLGAAYSLACWGLYLSLETMFSFPLHILRVFKILLVVLSLSLFIQFSENSQLCCRSQGCILTVECTGSLTLHWDACLLHICSDLHLARLIANVTSWFLCRHSFLEWLLCPSPSNSCPMHVSLQGLPASYLRHHLHNRNTHFLVSCISLDNMVLSVDSGVWLLLTQLFFTAWGSPMITPPICLMTPVISFNSNRSLTPLPQKREAKIGQVCCACYSMHGRCFLQVLNVFITI